MDLRGNIEIKLGSERSFGFVFAAVFLIVSLLPLVGDGNVRIWALVVAGAFTVAALATPNVLRPLNRLWFRLGLFLNEIISPVVMGVIFFLTVTPIGLFRRARDSDPLKQRIDPDAQTYWIAVDPEHVARSSMKKQF